jgi:signal transduction histidine kinase/ligand-binding sensor domain-containing protein
MNLKCGIPTKACLVVVLAHGLFLLTWQSAFVNAQQLSISHYDVGDGLAHSQVTSIFQDSKGYIWFGTFEGLSRFDGYRFTNYSTADGLGHLLINDVKEDRRGRLWIATNGGGVARSIDDVQQTSPPQPGGPSVKKKFISYKIGESEEANYVNQILFDGDNSLWCLTDDGVYRTALADPVGQLKFERVIPTRERMMALTDSQGRIWFSTNRELIRLAQGQIEKYKVPDGKSAIATSHAVIGEDRQHRMFYAYGSQLFEFLPDACCKDSDHWRKIPLSLGQGREISSMITDAENGLWIGTTKGLLNYKNDGQTNYSNAQVVNSGTVKALASDREGNLWLGTEISGAYKMSENRLASYAEAEGLSNRDVRKVIEDREGRIFILAGGGKILEILRGVAVAVPGAQSPLLSVMNNILLDSRGTWWITASNKLFRYPGPKLSFGEPRKVTRVDGIPESELVAGLYEDNAGRLWISSTDRVQSYLYQFDPNRTDRPTIQRIHLEGDRLIEPISKMLSDRSGALWLAMHGSLGRIANGKLSLLHPTEGLPETMPRVLFSDSRGWIWIGLRYGGVSVTKDPAAEQPKFTNYSPRDGLQSSTVQAISEDNFGRIYLGTGRGVDQLDPTSGRIRHFTTADGLAGTWINDCMKDSRGNIWIATRTGLTMMTPRAEKVVSQPPPVYLSHIQIAGEDLPLPETGALEVPELKLAASRNNLLIEYVGLSFAAEGALRYQYQLEGVDQDWSAPTEQRSVNYARLAAGLYRFKVRAIAPNGATSVTPAVIQFRILPPIWQRWWFLLLALTAAALAGYVFYRYRVTQLLELERVRTRIATDLHDDIGSNLSRIAILSEVVSHQVKHDGPQVREPLTKIAVTSRELVDSMSDIVWAINPAKDQLSDLTQRMRRFASDILTARNIEFRFRAPDVEAYLKVGADVRRQVFLIFKESVNNLVRHSACTGVDIELRIDGRHLLLTLKDNGKGFDPALLAEGHGLMSMRARAESIGGRLEIISKNGDGTTVSLLAPLVAAARRVDGRRGR